MSLRYFVHILFKRKWFILIALFAAPVVAAIMLVFLEPVFISSCKLELHDRSNANDPLSTVKSNLKDDVFIQANIELIFTDRVMNKVIDKAGLIPEPPSQSLYARFMGKTVTESNLTPDRQRIEIIRGLKKRVTVDAMSPVVMSIKSQMNTPENAQKVTRAVYESFCEEFERMQNEDTQFEKFYNNRRAALKGMIAECQKEIEEFNRLHARDTSTGSDPLVLPDQRSKETVTVPKAGNSESFNKRAAETSSIQQITNEITRLKIESFDLLQRYNKDHYLYRQNQEKIVDNQKLLEEIKKELSVQEVLAVKYSGLLWELDTLRQSYSKVNDDYQKVVLINSTKKNPMSSIQVQDFPTFDPQPIFPKKGMILIAATFIGLILGLAMAYIAHVLDSTYHLPEDFAADTELPVLASIPYDRALAA